MKKQTEIGRRELFRKLAGSAGAAALAAAIPGSAAAALAQDAPATGTGSATVRVILADGATVQWLAVTNAGMTVGGSTAITSGSTSLNTRIVTNAIAAIQAAGDGCGRRGRGRVVIADFRLPVVDCRSGAVSNG